MCSHDFTAFDAIAVVAGSSLALVAIFLAASAFAGWYEERRRRTVGAMVRGAALRAGVGAVHGTVRPLDGRAGGVLAMCTVTQRRAGSGRAWRDVGRVTTGSRFALALDDGEEIEVNPDGADITGILGTPTGLYEGGRLRDLLVRVSAGDDVWVTGLLSRPRQRGVGAYRSGETPRTLRAPRGGRLEISTESPLPRWTALASAHKTGAYLAVGVLAALHALAFRKVDVALLTDRLPALGDMLELHPGFVGFVAAAGLGAVTLTALTWAFGVKRARRTR